MSQIEYFVGIDVGSTTVKCLLVDAVSLEIIWCRYQRHETRQAPVLLDMLTAMEAEYPQLRQGKARVYMTGSGAGPLSKVLKASYVQEVNAITLAVERLHPRVNSVIELGGQDAKMILFKQYSHKEGRQVITSMNDKCASGTGATIDKCLLKVGMSYDDLNSLTYSDEKIHHIAAKCGVFAETDIVNLIKSGVPSDEIMNSLANAIVLQNLNVLTRGNTLIPNVLLLGGPNCFLPFLVQCWRKRIPETWGERGLIAPKQPIKELISVPDNAQYFAALGSILFGLNESKASSTYSGADSLRHYIESRTSGKSHKNTELPLVLDDEDLRSFMQRYKNPKFVSVKPKPGDRVCAYLGIDGGSTTTKVVLLDDKGKLLTKQYLISRGNPIEDIKGILLTVRKYYTQQGCDINVLGCGVTGYAGEVLQKALKCDVNLVETIAHKISAQYYFGDDVDVICDIGGQDIKVLFLKDGEIRNFKLSNQCSAGNGMLLQAMADQFGVKLEDYANVAFSAGVAPRFNYGCAVFLDSDRVNYQNEGFSREELFAGLAKVLPKNIWQYVVQIPRLAVFGTKFILQGGTQYNLAALKAQVDYISARVPGAEVQVHPHCGESGAIGVALEAKRVVQQRGGSSFIGLDEAINIKYKTITDESTRCTFCENFCSRTFVDIDLTTGEYARHIAGYSCEKGTVESKSEVIALHKERRQLKINYPNLVDYESQLVFRHFYKNAAIPEDGSIIGDVRVKRGLLAIKCQPYKRTFKRSNTISIKRREKIRIGIPRVLNHYTVAPFLRTYLETLGITQGNILFSEETSDRLWSTGGRYGSIDPCYPAKVSTAHIHNLLFKKSGRKPLNFIWFPCITHFPNYVRPTMGESTCPVLAGTPNVVKAAYTKEKDYFTTSGVKYVDMALDFTQQSLLKQQLFNSWGDRLDITKDESDWACEQGWLAMKSCDAELQRRGMEVLTKAERENNIVILMVGRPYHNDPGLNHRIMEEFQSLGYPILSIRSIPKSPEYQSNYFHDDINSGLIEDAFDIRDVWPENYSVNSAQKVWAAKFAARHENIAVVDLSSFKCGHDAPIYNLIDNIISRAKRPYLTLHDIDANNPSGSLKIRVNTFSYALDRYKEILLAKESKRTEIKREIFKKRQELVATFLDQTESENNDEEMNAIFAAYLEEEWEEETPNSENAIPMKPRKIIPIVIASSRDEQKQQIHKY